MRDRLLRNLGLSFLIDGVALALFGRSYARLWRLGSREGSYYEYDGPFARLALVVLEK